MLRISGQMRSFGEIDVPGLGFGLVVMLIRHRLHIRRADGRASSDRCRRDVDKRRALRDRDVVMTRRLTDDSVYCGDRCEIRSHLPPRD